MNDQPVGLLDTSAVILLGRIDDPGLLPEQLRISTVTLAELTVGPLLAATESERVARQAHLQAAESDFTAIPFDAAAAAAAARAFGGVASNLRAQGRKPSARSFDAMIAATAIANGLPLATFNPRGFTDIDMLTGIGLPSIDDPVRSTND